MVLFVAGLHGTTLLTPHWPRDPGAVHAARRPIRGRVIEYLHHAALGLWRAFGPASPSASSWQPPDRHY